MKARWRGWVYVLRQTAGITITVNPYFLTSIPPEKSLVGLSAVENNGGRDSAIQLRNRHWRITDCGPRRCGRRVVGEQPVLRPVTFFNTSGTLPPLGIDGSYQMEPATPVSSSTSRFQLLP